MGVNDVELTGYTGLQAGVIKSPTDNAYLNAGALFGGEINYKGTFARGQVEAGSALGGKLEIGHSFDIGKNMGLDITGKASVNHYLGQNNTKTFSAAASSSTNVETGNKTYNSTYNYQSINAQSWSSGETRLGGGAKFTFGSNKVNFGVGVEAGGRKGARPEMTYDYSMTNKTEVTVNGDQVSAPTATTENYSGAMKNNLEFYVTPTLTANVKLGKNFSLNANADRYQGQVGIRYNFN